MTVEPLPDGALAVIRRDDERLTQEQRLADPTRLFWDRHCLLAEVDRLTAKVAEQAATLQRVRDLADAYERATLHQKYPLSQVPADIRAALDGAE